MDDFVKIPMLSVHPDKINVYYECQRFKPSKFERPLNFQMPQSNHHNDKISKQATRKISRAVDYLVFLASDKKLPATAHGKNLSFKICFITLTLSSTQIHSDNEIKSKLLNQFFIEARKKWNLKNYVWRAEKQKNGNIHFHILCDRFIPWSELRDCWNRIQNKLGYVDRYREEMLAFHKGGFKVREQLLEKWSYKNQLKAYREGSKKDWNSPNSTDIHSLRFVKDCKAYVMKYCTKDDQTENMIGRLWGCNYELTNIPGARIVVDSYIEKELRSAFRKVRPRFYKGEHFLVIYLTPQQLAASGSFEIVREFAEFLLDHFSYNYQFSSS